MPSFYTHHRFGQELLPTLPAAVRRTIQRFPQLFHVGLQGPDLFFYHHPLLKTAAGKLGTQFHRQSGQEFFSRVCREPAATEAGRAYLYGLLAHYCLDSICHPFVHAHTDDGPIAHVELESEFERFLLESDGKLPPHRFDRSPHMRLTRGECVTVAQFYPPAGPGAILSAVRCYARCLRIFTASEGFRRNTVQTVMKLGGPRVFHQLLPTDPNQRCASLNGDLLALYSQALDRYPTLLASLLAHLEHGTPLGGEFEATFG